MQRFLSRRSLKALDYRLREMTENGNWRLSECHSNLTPFWRFWREDQATERGELGPTSRET
jgi:hypothetical protein